MSESQKFQLQIFCFGPVTSSLHCLTTVCGYHALALSFRNCVLGQATGLNQWIALCHCSSSSLGFTYFRKAKLTFDYAFLNVEPSLEIGGVIPKLLIGLLSVCFYAPAVGFVLLAKSSRCLIGCGVKMSRPEGVFIIRSELSVLVSNSHEFALTQHSIARGNLVTF